MAALHFHHEKPRHLLRLHREALAGELDGAGVEAWLERESAATGYGVPVEVSAEDLEELVESSTMVIPTDEHRSSHSAAGDFARWRCMGGLATLGRNGSDWFSPLALWTWGRISLADLEAARPLR